MAEPNCPLPVATCTPRPTSPPTEAMMPPAVGDTELAITSLSAGTTCGSAADSEDRKNRFTPSTSSTPMYSGTPSLPPATSAAVSTTNSERTTAE